MVGHFSSSLKGSKARRQMLRKKQQTRSCIQRSVQEILKQKERSKRSEYQELRKFTERYMCMTFVVRPLEKQQANCASEKIARNDL